MDNHYETLQKNQLYIDKTASLEKGIAVFPSIYVEGAAASGKTTAVRMLLAKHPEVTSYVLWMGEKQDKLRDTLEWLKERMRQETIWVVLEDFHKVQEEEICSMLCTWIQQMPVTSRVILVGREYLPASMLSLLWKRKLTIIFQEELLFTRLEVQRMIEEGACSYHSEELHRLTGGWAGYVELACRLWKPYKTLHQLQESYEIRSYVQEELLGSCSKEEQHLLRDIAVCPWVTEELCQEFWHWQSVKEKMISLHRKGFLLYEPIRKRYKLAPVLVGMMEERESFNRKELAFWYEERGFIKAALLVWQKESPEAYRDCLLRHYSKVPFLQVPYDMVMQKRLGSLEHHYLRGMKCYERQDFEGLAQEIVCVKKWKAKTEEEKRKKEEIYLNLMYVNPNVTLEEWLALLEAGERMHLYGVLGDGYSYLCGIRDLTGLFTGARKEEKRRARIWKEHLGEWEWVVYQLARIDYYLETKREDSILEEDENLLRWVTGHDMEQSFFLSSGQEMWKVRLSGFYLLCKRMGTKKDDSMKEQILWLESSLLTEENPVCVRNTEAIAGLYATWLKEPERLSRWLRSMEEEVWDIVAEDNYGVLCLQAKGYILLGHYKKAERILTTLLPYLQSYHKNRFCAEALFQMAVVNWQKGKKGQALRNTLESFLISEQNRYVGFYTQYGTVGREVLESYMEWLKQTTPEGWRRKKKYNYGNVNHMPMEDYLEVILRGAKKETRHQAEFRKYKEEESLTMMETIILQDISRGLTNQEICQEQNLKLPTVKSHIYSLYKKLGVNNRMQAVNRGKERGIIK